MRITHTDVHENLYAIRWGDGLTTDGVVPRRSGPGVVTFSHRYAPGWDGTLTAVVAQNGRVLEYVQRLRRGGAGSHMQVDSEPPPPPPHAFAPAPPP